MATHAASRPASQGQPGYFNLGDYTRSISTESQDAQRWFDRGLIWSYAFNHEESVACFERAIEADPNCAMAYWGVAYALGPNYNKPWDFFDEQELRSTVERTHRAASQALARSAEHATAAEQAVIKALQLRYPSQPPTNGGTPADWRVWNSAYAFAMGDVYVAHGARDLDVAALYADALMNLTPWKLWNIHTGNPGPGALTLEIRAVLGRALSQEGGDRHPGLLHLHIHLMEMSRWPEAALLSADALAALVPDAGHLRHMPSHLYVLCGDYARAVQANTAAIEADERFFAGEGDNDGGGAGGPAPAAKAPRFYSLYRAHDLHFRIYAALFAGQSRVALETAQMLERVLPESLLRVESPPMADWLEGFLAMGVHVLVRFGRWDDIIALALPADRDLYCSVTAMLHYAKGVAYAATAKIADAEAQQTAFRQAVGRVPPSRTVFNNTCVDILGVAGAMLDGELEYRRGNFETAFEHLRKAIAIDDGLPYDEPWGWMQPTRHAYGALLLEQGHVQEALEVYEADLGLDDTLPRAQRHPNNVWSLHGYHECLFRLGLEAEADLIHPQVEKALAVADVPVTSSCACRIGTH